MTISTAKMTARQFLELGEDPVGVRLELVNGEVAVSPSPIPDHSFTDRALSAILYNHIRRHSLGRLYGDVDTIFGEYDVRRPDLIFFRQDRLHLVGKKAMEGPPDLCVEIISPSSGRIDRQDKFAQYERAGVPFYWIVDPQKRSIEAYRLADNQFQPAGSNQFQPAGSGENDAVVRLAPFDDLDIPLLEIWQPS